MAWRFAIDVGGTFTDCIGCAPDAALRTHKLLSTGAYKGVVAAGATRACIVSHSWRDAPARFFDGFDVSIGGERAGVASFDREPGDFQLSVPLSAAPPPGTPFELRCGLEAPVVGIRWLLARRLDEPIGPVDVRIGTTRGTNALLERAGAATAFVTTRGFGDVLRIAYQDRPRLFDLNIRKPVELFRTSIEVHERIAADGTVLEPLDERDARDRFAAARRDGIESVAVCLMNSYRNPIHEQRLGRMAREAGFGSVRLSCDVSPLQRIVPRGDTTVVDAYLSPIIRGYVASLRRQMPLARLWMMTSNGGLTDADDFAAKDSVLSGPAGGVVACARIASEFPAFRHDVVIGHEPQPSGSGLGDRRAPPAVTPVIGFDMGGTSTDVCRFDGRFERRHELRLTDAATRTDVRIMSPMLAVETVAAGGGSVCGFDGVKPVVGPRSAGAAPGPACYGNGGPLCITDCNVLLGRIPPGHFPFSLDVPAAMSRLDGLIEDIAAATGRRYTRDELAAGLIDIAVAHMSDAIRRISVARGYDVREYALVAFGGAGGQHACAVAERLGIRRIVAHPLAGLLSAWGIGQAAIARQTAVDVGSVYSAESLAELEVRFRAAEAELSNQVRARSGGATANISVHRALDLRYAGQDALIPVPRPDDDDYAAAFERLHERQYGFKFAGRAIEIRALRVEAVAEARDPDRAMQSAAARFPATDAVPLRTESVHLGGRRVEAPIYLRESMRAGQSVSGPAIIIEPHGAFVVAPGWTATRTPRDVLEVMRTGEPAATASSDGVPDELGCNPESAGDPIHLELFCRRFTAIAEEMGETLKRTALSTNVKERLDFSCALFDADGRLVVNAPHIPVHLGSMGECVRQLRARISDVRPGDVYVTNHPFRGGTHLPDVTVVTPVFASPAPEGSSEAHRKPDFFVASRAHHAEIGGVTPGSMPPASQTLADEGVVIDACRMVRAGISDEGALRRLLAGGAHPSRRVDENIADIHAQTAANQTGERRLRELLDAHGLPLVAAYMRHIQTAGERQMRAAIRHLPRGARSFTDHFDDGTPLSVRIEIGDGRASVDFGGTAPVHAGNFNANRAIVTSALLYCFRCLIDDDVPLCDGVLAPIEIILPECMINPPAHDDPRRCAAVAAGNVETSQRIVDAVFGALGVVAASQGTMNNLIFGDDTFGYYETIGGGSGAGPDFDGAHAVHSHMTNTRLTDPEVLEDRYPVRLLTFAIRRRSGGIGRHRGGDGIIREMMFLRPLELSLITQRRVRGPYGVSGGHGGSPGRNLLFRSVSGGTYTEPAGEGLDLGPVCHTRIRAGDILRVETPGGGGFGLAEDPPHAPDAPAPGPAAAG